MTRRGRGEVAEEAARGRAILPPGTRGRIGLFNEDADEARKKRQDTATELRL